jgi:hypothetical protein
MTGALGARVAFAITVTLITLLGGARSFAANPPTPPTPPDSILDLPPGLACEFELRVEIWNNPNRVVREFKDKNGNVVRLLNAGKGNTLRFTNLGSSETLTLRPNGSVEHITLSPDGSQTWMVTGHNVLILFPTDVPAGPSTTLYVGQVVFTVDPNGVFTLQETSGTATDLCAALSQ